MVGTEHRVYGASAKALVKIRASAARRSMFGVVCRW
jgi:hypothetical protein